LFPKGTQSNFAFTESIRYSKKFSCTPRLSNQIRSSVDMKDKIVLVNYWAIRLEFLLISGTFKIFTTTKKSKKTMGISSNNNCVIFFYCSNELISK